MSLENAKTAFLAAIDAANPTHLVKNKIRSGALDDWFQDRMNPKPIHVIALGKAAPRMVWGLLEANVPFAGIGVTTPGQRKPSLERFWHVGGHPAPDAASFAAGQAVFDWVDRLPQDARVLVLLSGGTSSCVEVSQTPDEVVALTQRGLGADIDIQELNRIRRRMSQFKGGGLGRRLLDRGAQVRCWVLNDVAPGQERQVGSGPCDLPEIEHISLADRELVAHSAAQMLRALGHDVEIGAPIAGPVEDAVGTFMADLPTNKLRIAVGEATVQLPDVAPVGGRCSHAALAAASHLMSGFFFAGATDGLDGTTGDAAAWSLPGDEDGEALASRRSHEVLAAKRQTLRLGATGTNLNDLWVVGPSNA